MGPGDLLCPDDQADSPAIYDGGTHYHGYTLTYQSDGNLVLYRSDWDGVNPTTCTALWDSKTHSNYPGAAVMQTDGNFVIYDGNGGWVWTAGDGNGTGRFHNIAGSGMKVQTDGKICMYGPSPSYVWLWCNRF